MPGTPPGTPIQPTGPEPDATEQQQATEQQVVEPQWTTSPVLTRAVILVAALILASAVLGRFDLVVLAAPFAIGTAAALRQRGRPERAPQLTVSPTGPDASEGGEAGAHLTITNVDPVGYPLVLVRAGCSPWLRLTRADRPYVLGVPAEQSAIIELTGTARRWGWQGVGPAVAYAVCADGLLVSTAATARTVHLKVYPRTPPFDATDAMPRAAGLIGVHHSRRPGEGGELAGVRVFGPGDRLRRIDWRVSLRTRQLHVAATLSDRDAEVLLLLDVAHEAGRSGGVDGAASVIDTTVRAAAAISDHYLNQGDRVGLLEHGGTGRRLRSGSGRRHYLLILEWLLGIEADAVGGPDLGFALHHLPPSALIVVLTPLLDPAATDALAGLARAGRFVVAVDTLPEQLTPTGSGVWAEHALRLWRLERDIIVEQLREHGVPVVRWQGAGSLDQVLRDAARLAAAPRVGVR